MVEKSTMQISLIIITEEREDKTTNIDVTNEATNIHVGRRGYPPPCNHHVGSKTWMVNAFNRLSIAGVHRSPGRSHAL